MSSDRDIPSVPVTTLAGLTSLSDLLSELPVSDSLSNVAPLNRSLLFHTLVANESNNLLSIRDDNLVRQLVHAIEQTNSDNIELKPQFAIQQHGTNISAYPELLQGIYNYRPTVFNTPVKTANHVGHQHNSPQYQQQRQQNVYNESSLNALAGNASNLMSLPNNQQHHLIQQQQQQQQQLQNSSNEIINQQQQQQQQHLPTSPVITDAPVTRRSRRNNNNVMEQQLQSATLQQQLQQQEQQMQPLQNHQQYDTTAAPCLPDTRTTQYGLAQQQQQQQYSQQMQQNPLTPQMNATGIYNQQMAGQTSVIQSQIQMPEHHEQQLQQQQNHQFPPHQPYIEQQQSADMFNASTMSVEQSQQSVITNQQDLLKKQQLFQQQQIQQQQLQQQQLQQQSLQQQARGFLPPNQLQQEQQTSQQSFFDQQPTVQGNFQNVLLQQQELHMLKQQQMMHKAAPRNNEFLLNQQPNKNPSNQSPAQAATASDAQQQLQQQSSTFVAASNATTAINPSFTSPLGNFSMSAIDGTASNEGGAGIGGSSSSRSSSSGSRQVSVRINRLKTEHASLLQNSIKEFVQKSPEAAQKIGLPVSVDLLKSELDSVNSSHPGVLKTPGLPDAFTMMKADEKRSTTKRKIPISIDDIPPEQIFSKPKLRRVERISVVPNPKSSREDVMRSQTYQQFMKNMEQIIELLDDSESPNFESDEIDENVECIPSKMLNTMSNDVAKLKAKQALDAIPKNKLTLLINYAMRNIYLAKNYSAGPDDEEEIIDDEVMEKILNAMEACLLISNIYSTTKDLKFLQEDNISMIIKFVQFQFRETIFPSYDSVYTVKSMKKADNRKKSRVHQNHNRSLQLLYSKAVELMKVFVSLFDKCIFVDTIVLPLSTLAIEPFFVDNIETLQFVCLELVTTIFRKERYEKIRSSILGDILSSIDRLPSSKKNLRPFKLANNGGNIQMVTALVLQLIQCASVLPDSLCEGGGGGGGQGRSRNLSQQLIDLDEEISGGTSKGGRSNSDVLILKKYDVAISIGGNFLTTFLNKCKARSNDTDFRPLFENFIHDLLATVNRPEWPASELLLSLLGTMLVRYVSNKSIEQSIRIVSLDYLGIVAARLRKDTVESRCKVHIIDSMIKSIKTEQEKEGDIPVAKNNKIELDPEEERNEFLQKVLLDYLAVNAQEENMIWDYARHFYLTQWYRDIIYQRRRIAEGGKGYASRKKNKGRRKRQKDGSMESSDSDSDMDTDDETNATNTRTGAGGVDQELNVEIFNALEKRKKYLLSKIKPYSSVNDLNPTSSQHIKTYIDYNNAHLIAQYLASKRPFSQSFDGYLKKIILVVNEQSIAVRTRAMKCLANIVEVDPMVLKRKDMQMGVNQKFLDAAISVREAAVDLVGKFVLSNEELIDQYYDMLSTRILDTGVSVRKRVIKILRDICIEYPDFEKIPEICVKMIRRVHDEEGIQKLVTEVFMKMWFMPCTKNDKYAIQRKINQIIDVVNKAHDSGTAWLEGLLNSIFQPKENMMKMDGSAQEPVKKNTEPPAEIVLACQQLADGLVDRLIELEDTDNARMLGCITTLHLLAKVRPQLLVRHAMTIEPYLNIKCHPSTAPKFICAVADILEKVVPLVQNASESFLASLEEHLMLLVVSLNQAVVSSCVSCLGAVVNKITKNYKLIRDCFQKFYKILDHSRNQVVQNNNSIESIYTPMFRRSLFTIGILMRYFDFKMPQVYGENSGLSTTICDDVFACLMFFNQCYNQEVRKQALIALGSFCVMNDDYLTRSELKQFYCDLLHSDTCEPSVKIICMRNIWIYLTESEMNMYNKEKEWEKQSKAEDLKEMNDVSSGMASHVIQLYLQEILDCFLHRDDDVRLWAVKVVQIVLRQGLVHPVRMVPYLICLSTDSKLEAAHRADALLKDIDKSYSGFVNMKLQYGLQLSFQLQEILQCNNNKVNQNGIVRGYIKKGSDNTPSSLNDFLYSLVRVTKPQRRALIQTVTKQFDDQKTSLRQLLYIADNLAYFPYVVQDEPLYLIHQIDLLVSIAGTNLLTTFKESFKPSENASDVLEDDDDEEDPEILAKRLPDDTTESEKCITSAQACMLLLVLKDHLKQMYGLTDSKISRYSPSEPKVYEKAIPRRNVGEFTPETTINVIKNQQEQMTDNSVESHIKKPLTEDERRDLIQRYLDFKQLMLKLDPDEADSDEEGRDKTKANNSTISDSTPTTSFLNTTEANQTMDSSFANSSNAGLNASANMLATPMLNNIHNMTSTPGGMVKDIPLTPPTARNVLSNKATPLHKSGNVATPTSRRQQPQRSNSSNKKRSKRKAIASDDDDDYSDEDYA